jgi:hypothetical protein
MAKGFVANLELIFAVMLYSVLLTLYYANTYTTQANESSVFAAYSNSLIEMSRVQGALYALDGRGLQKGELEASLNASIGAPYTLTPFSVNPQNVSSCAGCIKRIVIGNGSAYYLQVYYNETSIQH